MAEREEPRGMPSKKTFTDEQLMLQVRDGDRKSFEELMKRYKKSLFNYIYRFSGNRHTSEDIFQETFLKIYQHAGRYKPKSKFSTYLYTIATNLSINEMKKRKIRQHETLESGYIEGRQNPHIYESSLPSDVSTPATETEREENRRLIWEGLDQLSPKHRSVLILSEFEELPYEEIAQITKTRVGTVKSRLHRAKIQLKEWIEKHEQMSV